MKKVLITGCSGYIGSHLSKLLTDKKYKVYGLDIVDPQYPVSKFYKIDITNNYNITEEFDAVIHLAAKISVNESQKEPLAYYNTNIFGTANLLKNIKTKNFIFASTGTAEYCNSSYGISKRACEDVVKELCSKMNIPYTIFRFYNVFGTNGFSATNYDGLTHSLFKSKETKTFTIYGNDYDTPDGTCIRDYIHVNDICESIESAISNCTNSIECLGYGLGTSVLEMFNTFKKVNNLDINLNIGPRRDGDLPVCVLKNISKFMIDKKFNINDLLKI